MINPHDHARINEIIYDAFSGYVHGAYPHIMELFGGNPPQYHMAGMLGASRIQEWQRQLIHYAYRGVLGAWYVAKRLGEDGIAADIFSLRNDMELRYPQLAANPNDLLKDVKKKARK